MLLVKNALKLYTNITCKYFVVSGYRGEALTIKDQMVTRGIESDAEYTEEFASNTFENIVNSMAYIEYALHQEHFKDILLLCKNYAARRRVLTVSK